MSPGWGKRKTPPYERTGFALSIRFWILRRRVLRTNRSALSYHTDCDKVPAQRIFMLEGVGRFP
jgi:hypothetical protein